MQSAGDIVWFSDKIYERTRERISATTLKRIFGYIKEDVKPRKFTLDLIAQYIGYRSYAEFCEKMNRGESQSGMIEGESISADSLVEGQMLRISWLPDRECVVEYKGDGRFEVVAAKNTKLSVGDTFSCHLFVNHEPLFLDRLIHEGGKPTVYVAGSKNGVVIEPVSD